MEPTPAPAPAPRRARHLMDPAHPPAPSAPMALGRVQKWVMSALAVTTIMHLSAGLVIAAVFIDGDLTAQVGLNVIAAAFGVVAIVSGFLIHGRNPVSPWLLLGLIPGAIGLLIVLT